jgi:hypothetical protein
MWRMLGYRFLPRVQSLFCASSLFVLLCTSFAQEQTLQAPPTSALKYGWYAVQLGPPHYDPDREKTNLWSMYQFCFANARKYHMDKFHVSLAHLSADPWCVRVDGKAPKAIRRLPGCVSVQLTADCVAEPEGIIPEVDPQKLKLAWKKAFAALGIQVPANFMAYQDPQPNNILKYQIRISKNYQVQPSWGWILEQIQNGVIKPGTVPGSKFLLLGSVQVVAGSTPTNGTIRVNARLVVVETAEIIAAGKGTSPGLSQYGLEMDVSNALAALHTRFQN